MLNSSPIVALLAITDFARSRTYYERVLGLTFLHDDRFALVFDANGTTLRLAKVDTLAPAPYTVLGWHVAEIRAERESLAAKGVTFELFPGLQQDDLGVCTFPGGSQVAWFKDPDGNLLSLTQTV